jgi:hypothetical protein
MTSNAERAMTFLSRVDEVLAQHEALIVEAARLFPPSDPLTRAPCLTSQRRSNSGEPLGSGPLGDSE